MRRNHNSTINSSTPDILQSSFLTWPKSIEEESEAGFCVKIASDRKRTAHRLELPCAAKSYTQAKQAAKYDHVKRTQEQMVRSVCKQYNHTRNLQIRAEPRGRVSKKDEEACPNGSSNGELEDQHVQRLPCDGCTSILKWNRGSHDGV